MVRLWRLYQGGDMGVGHLPDAGGSMDQAAIMLDAFSLMSDFDARQRAKGAMPLNEDGETDWAAQEDADTRSWGVLA